MKTKDGWPRGPYHWIENRTLFVSIPFTWNLPDMRRELHQQAFAYDRAIIGGPAVKIMPEYLAGIPKVTIGGGSCLGRDR